MSQDRLIFNMGIPILARRHLYIETAPSWVYWKTKAKAGEITEIANLDMEGNLETIRRNRWELSTAYWILLFFVSNKLVELSINCTSGLSLIYPRSRGFLRPNQHYTDVIMGAMASQFASITIVYSTVYSGADQRKHQSSASLAFVWRIHRWPVNSLHKWPVTLKMFLLDDVIMKLNTFSHFLPPELLVLLTVAIVDYSYCFGPLTLWLLGQVTTFQLFNSEHNLKNSIWSKWLFLILWVIIDE